MLFLAFPNIHVLTTVHQLLLRERKYACVHGGCFFRNNIWVSCGVFLGYSVSDNSKNMRMPWTSLTLYILRKYLCLPKKVKLSSSLILRPFLAEPIWQQKSLFAAKRSRLWQHCAKVKPCRCFCGGSTNVKNAAGKLPAWATQGSQHLSCPGVCVSQEPWQHSCLINIFARETIVGFPSYVGTPEPELSVTLS